MRGMSPVNSFTESEMENMQPVGHEIDKSNWRSDKYINVLGIGMEYPAGTSPKTMSKVSSKLRACQPSKISIRSPKKSTKKQKEQAPTVDITHITYNEVRSPTPSVSRTLSIRSWRLPKFQTAEKSSDTQSGNYTGAVISTPRPMSFGRVFQRPPVQVIGNPSRHSYYKSDVDGSDLSLRGSSAPESTDGRMSVPFKLVTQPLRAHSAGDLSTQNRSSFKPRFCRPRWPTDPQNLNYAASSASETSEEIEKFWHSQITNNDISFPVFSRVPVHQNGASLSRPGWAFDSEQDTQAVWRDATLEIPSETPQLLHTNTSLNNSPLSITTPTNCMSFFPVPSSPVSSHLYSPRTEQEGDLYLQPERPQSRWSNYSEKETTSLRHHISTWSQMIRSSSGTSVDYGQKPLQSSEYLSAPEMIKSFSTQSARRDKEQLFRTSFLHQAKESVKHAIQRAESDSPSPRTSTSNESLDTEKKSSVQGRARHAEKKSDGKEKRSRTTEVFTKMIPGRGRREKGRYEEERRRALLKAKIRVIHSDSDGVLI